jgi:hypothetical protein
VLTNRGQSRAPGRGAGHAAAGLATACAVLLVAGCASSQPPAEAVRTSAPPTRALPARYLAIAQPANRQLDHDFDGLQDNENTDLATADSDLRSAAATEHRFDGQLIAITFPPQTEPIVRLLVDVNQARVTLTETAAAARSLRQLHGYQRRLEGANEPVEEAVTVIRSQLGLPPADTS